jgi:hypothetical protein
MIKCHYNLIEYKYIKKVKFYLSFWKGNFRRLIKSDENNTNKKCQSKPMR